MSTTETSGVATNENNASRAGKPRRARTAIMLSLWLFTALASTGLAGTVAVTRNLPSSVLTTDTSCQVALTIAVTDTSPNGLIITESLPANWTISEATWEGNTLDPVLIGGEYKWLFDTHGGQAVAAGTMAYTVNIPDGTSAGSYAFSGTAKWMDNETETTETAIGDTSMEVLTPVSVASATVQTGRSVSLVFSDDVGSSAVLGSNYVLSGDGKGTLTENPDTVSDQGNDTYLLSWIAGEMAIGGSITVTAAGVLDTNGHPVGTPAAATHEGAGIGEYPEVAAVVPTMGSVVTSASITVDVTYSETVIGVDATDLVLTGTGTTAAAVGTPTDQGGNVWRFAVTGLTTGPANISLAPDASDIEDSAGNDLANATWSYTVDVNPPEVLTVVPSEGAVVTASTVDVDVTFSEAVIGVDSTDLVLTGTGATAATVGAPADQGDNVWRFPVSGLTSGAVDVSLAADASDIEDTAGNDLAGETWTFTVDVDPPEVLTVVPIEGSMVTATAIDIDVTFSEAVVGVDSTDLVLSGTGTDAAVVGTPTDQGGNVWRFPVSGLASGAVDVSLAADAGDIQDGTGKDLPSSNWAYTVSIAVPHPYDADGNWVIGATELQTLKTDWANDAISEYDPDFFLLWTIDLYEAGVYEYGHGESGYSVWQAGE